MKENATPPKNEKKEKVGADGLTKKERRALKVAEKVEQKPPCENEIVKKPSPGKPKVQAEKLPVETAPKKDKKSHKTIQKATSNVIPNPAVNIKEDVSAEGKSKAQLRAERREIQEKQRLAKLASKDNNLKKDTEKVISTKTLQKSPKKVKREFPKKEHQSEVSLFNHLHFETFKNDGKCIISNVHPTFIGLGEQYLSKTILGSTARCLALLAAVKDLIADFVTPPKQEFCRSLETSLNESVKHLHKCRPFAVSMNNALRHFKVHLTQMCSSNMSDADKKCKLQEVVDIYVNEQIYMADKAISCLVNEKISDGDVIVTYGCSSLIKRILIDADKKFKVIVIDGRPMLEGREMLRQLINSGIDCSYCLINSASFVISKATKVLLGAHALLANGSVMARTGTAQIALIAQSYSKPVLVCCETYKFCERVQTDSFVYNELGDSNKMSIIDSADEANPILANNTAKVPLTLNLMYDVTPPDFVTAVVTELGILPCTSVPVILRIKPVTE